VKHLNFSPNDRTNVGVVLYVESPKIELHLWHYPLARKKAPRRYATRQET